MRGAAAGDTSAIGGVRDGVAAGGAIGGEGAGAALPRCSRLGSAETALEAIHAPAEVVEVAPELHAAKKRQQRQHDKDDADEADEAGDHR